MVKGSEGESKGPRVPPSSRSAASMGSSNGLKGPPRLNNGKGKAPPAATSLPQAASGKGKGRVDWRAKRQEEEESRKKLARVDVCSLPAGDLVNPQWETTFAAVASAEGSDGVVFIATKAGGYAVKASSKPAEEYFATKVLRHLGVRAPDIRIVCHVDSEWRDIKNAVRVGEERARARGDEAAANVLKLRQSGPLNRAQLSVMCLVSKASPLLSNAQAQAFFGGQADSDDVRRELAMLGRCLAVDVFLNNCDRLMAPCWDNEGNAGNLLLAQATAPNAVTNSALHVVAIDSAGTCISKSNAKFQEYIERARSFLYRICDDGCALDALRPLQAFIYANCAVWLDEEALLEARRGVLQVIVNISAMPASGESFVVWLEELKTKIRDHTVRFDWENVWQRSADLIDMEFLRHMVSVFQEVAWSYRKCLPQPSDCDAETVAATATQPRVASQSRMSDELWDALPAAIQDELTSVHDKPFKILVMQMVSTTAVACARLVANALVTDCEQTGQKARLVLLPENVIKEHLLSDIAPLLSDEKGRAPQPSPVPPELKEFAAVAENHCVYIICGSMYEPRMERHYITSIVVGPDGLAVGAYRKRRIHNHEVQLQGDRPLVFTVPDLGKAAVLICLDAEDNSLRDEVIDLGVRCVLNPIAIPTPSGNSGDDQKYMWQTAMDQMASDFQSVCHYRGITWVRCDRPGPESGMGTSQVIGPEFTHRACCMKAETMRVCLLPPASSAGHVPLFLTVPASSYGRSDPKQNCGPRCTIYSAFVDGQVTSMLFFFSADQIGAKDKKIVPDRMHLTFADESVANLQMSPSISVEKVGKPGTLEFHDVIHDAGVAATEEARPAIDGRTHSRWLDNDRRFLLDLNDTGSLLLQKLGSDGNLRRPLIIPAGERYHGFTVHQPSGMIATVSWLGDVQSKVSVWSFSHNCIQAPFAEFLNL